MTIYRNSKGRTIGKHTGGTFTKTVQKSKHLFRATGGSWGIQESVLQQLPDKTGIEIFEKEEKILYVTTVEQFRKHCIYLEFEDGLQAFLSLEHFKQEPVTARQLAKPEWV